jgi:3-carboxy-cis,cis-muconate cycloisomerase
MGLLNTEADMMALGPQMGREKAHDKISAICIAVSQGKGRLIDLLTEESEIRKIFDRQALARSLHLTNYMGKSGAKEDRVLNGRKG